MASKASKGPRSVSKETHIKYVRRAKMWCKTFFENGQQKQEWTLDKPS